MSTLSEALATAVHADMCDGSKSHHHGDCAGAADRLLASDVLRRAEAVIEAAVAWREAERYLEVLYDIGDCTPDEMNHGDERLDESKDALRLAVDAYLESARAALTGEAR